MQRIAMLSAVAGLLMVVSAANAAQISGEYLEARSCDVWTGPCFANAEMGLTGKEAVMAWKVDQGSWNNVSLDGLGAALVLKAEGTLGYDGVFDMTAGKIESVLIVDEKANETQRAALVAFVKDSAKDLTRNVVKIESAPITLKNDHLAGKGVFKAGKLASIETRAFKKSDCVCTNEEMFFLPLTEIENFSAAYTKQTAFRGKGLNANWELLGKRSAFLGTFRR